MVSLTIRKRDSGNILILDLEGNIDFSTSPQLKEEILIVAEDSSGRILLNFKQLDHIDMSGIATLVEGSQVLRKRHKKLELCSIPNPILRVFEVARLTDAFCIYPDEETAIAILE